MHSFLQCFSRTIERKERNNHTFQGIVLVSTTVWKHIKAKRVALNLRKKPTKELEVQRNLHLEVKISFKRDRGREGVVK